MQDRDLARSIQVVKGKSAMDIRLHGFDKSEAASITAYAEKKIARLESMLPRTIGTHCEVEKRGFANAERVCRVQITMQVRGRTLRAEIKGSNVLAALDAGTRKMERQIERFKGRKRRDRRSIRDEVPTTTLPEDNVAVEEELPVIVREKEFELSPMMVEEAVEVMELLGHDFHVFLNRDSDTINVVYRREDGNYGLLKPSTVAHAGV